jgi:hypothetical protein
LGQRTGVPAATGAESFSIAPHSGQVNWVCAMGLSLEQNGWGVPFMKKVGHRDPMKRTLRVEYE